MLNQGVISYGNIRGFGLQDQGIFKASKELFGWKNKRTNATYHYKPEEISGIEWLQLGPEENSCQLRVFIREKKDCVYFTGFRTEDLSIIKDHFKNNYGIELKERELITNGTNWGDLVVQNETICITGEDKVMMYVPTTEINQIAMPSKSELVLEFNDSINGGEDCDDIMEIRLFVPNMQNSVDGNSLTSAEKLRNDLQTLLGIGTSGSMDKVCRLNDIHLLVPRGRYEIEVLVNCMKLHGKSFDYTILYKSISRLFLLPRPGSSLVNLVVALETPMRQGNTKYPFVVMQFDTQQDDDIEMPLNLPEKELERFSGLSSVMTGKFWDIITRILKSLTGHSIIVPGDFRSAYQYHCIRCSYKAQDGLLYPLNRSFIYITKPVIMIRYDDVLNIEFSRMGGNQTRFFELTISIKGGGEYSFTSIDKAEYNPLIKFLQEKNIRIKNLEENIDSSRRTASKGHDKQDSNRKDSESKSILDQDLPSDDEEDEDFDEEEDSYSSSGGSEDEDDNNNDGDDDE
ncbi:structure-specific recognition 1 (SSRP1) (recombination signal sequence recognition) [Cryptosporidium bovis]|uniref:structure-specific recognition 1 (SSRP1) (recombination signal sequence recognition) n=1 Tax=Cryptosporidium bovis TaxID=310047 RepID=UPI00351A6C3C|nr:structure-specific recognition 1 (SSRP1) (recombination signal sequence recognition) [Cryptosporidium bovis]